MPDISKIDAIIAQVRARNTTDEQPTPIDRAAKQAQIAKEREERKAAKAARLEAKPPRTKPAHMSKVERAAAKLPRLFDFAQSVFDDITVNLGRDQLDALAQHILHHNRVKSTQRALDTKLEAGQQVRIIGGDPKWYGVRGTLSKVQRIRCYVEVPGANKPVYLFTSDVEPIAEDVARTGTEG